jgi:TldD protein
MDDLIRRAVTSVAGADYVEARVHRGRSTRVVYSGRELESIGESASLGGCVRVLANGAWGFCTFNDVRNIESYVRMALKQARMVGGGTERLAPVAPRTGRYPAVVDEDPGAVSLAEKEALCRGYNDILRAASEKIRTTSARYHDVIGSVLFANSEGTLVEQETAFCGVSVSAVAMDGTNVQSGYESVGDVSGFSKCRGLEPNCEEVARKAVELLAAEKPPAGKYTVICDPHLCGVFMHEAFGHLSEADFIYEHDRLREIMTLGRRFGFDQLSVVDDGSIPGLAGSYAFDSEGVPAEKTYLLRQGKLTGRLHSRETAAQMNEAPSGNARAISYTHPPIVRMSNTYMEPGDYDVGRMFEEVEDGIYAKSFLGGQTNMEMFSFSSEEAFRIRKGKVAERLRDVVLTGNVFYTLEHIDAIGNDLKFFGGLGGCGKGGQSPLRVADGGPHVRIRDVIVGGRQE